ncbi:MAG TPA: hypothetical protein VM737_01480 [Gemmatimonadota bacterium]|nr:hypothetical protein [Gemmatimonadota bacterium]
MDLERLRAWSYLRQRLAEPASGPGEALRAVVAVYATHPTAPVALWARTRSLTAAAYRRLDRDRRGLRIPGMRGTVFSPRATWRLGSSRPSALPAPACSAH